MDGFTSGDVETAGGDGLASGTGEASDGEDLALLVFGSVEVVVLHC